MTLALYLSRRMLATTGIVMVVFTAVALLFEVIEMVRRFGAVDAGFGMLVWVAALRVPGVIYEILPLLMLLASLGLFLGLARSSELVVIRAAGRNALRMLVEPALVALVIGALAVLVMNPVASLGYRMHEDRTRALGGGGGPVQLQLSVGSGAIWLRQGDDEGQWLMRAQGLGADGRTFERVSFQQIDGADGRPLRRIEADTALLADGEWRLERVKLWDLAAPNPEQVAQTLPDAVLPTNLTTERIGSIFANTWSISVWQLPGFIRELELAGLSARTHKAQFQMALALPVTMLAMMLIGAVLTLGHARAANTAIKVLVTVLAGFALFFMASFARVLGEVGQIPLGFAIWAPPFAAILLAVGALLALEDG